MNQDNQIPIEWDASENAFSEGLKCYTPNHLGVLTSARPAHDFQKGISFKLLQEARQIWLGVGRKKSESFDEMYLCKINSGQVKFLGTFQDTTVAKAISRNQTINVKFNQSEAELEFIVEGQSFKFKHEDFGNQANIFYWKIYFDDKDSEIEASAPKTTIKKQMNTIVKS